MGFAVLQEEPLEDRRNNMAAQAQKWTSAAQALQPGSSPLEGAEERVRAFAPFLGGGKSESRLEGLEESLK